MSDSKNSRSSSPESRAETLSAGESGKNGISRRNFLKGAGVTAAGTALLDGVQSFGRESESAADAGISQFVPGPAAIRLIVNGKEHALQIEPRTTLADALRIHLV